jgi:hypothetical protein
MDLAKATINHYPLLICKYLLKLLILYLNTKENLFWSILKKIVWAKEKIMSLG